MVPGQLLQARLCPVPLKNPVLYTHPAPWSCAPRSRAAWSRVNCHSSGGGAGAGRRREQAHNAEHPRSKATAPPIVPRHPARGCQPVPPAAAPERAPAATGTGEPSGATPPGDLTALPGTLHHSARTQRRWKGTVFSGGGRCLSLSLHPQQRGPGYWSLPIFHLHSN